MPEHFQEEFYSKLGSAGAIVCSCGFATTFTRIFPRSTELGWEHFHRMHDAFEVVRKPHDEGKP